MGSVRHCFIIVDFVIELGVRSESSYILWGEHFGARVAWRWVLFHCLEIYAGIISGGR